MCEPAVKKMRDDTRADIPMLSESECMSYLNAKSPCPPTVARDILLASLWAHGILGLPTTVDMGMFIHSKIDYVVQCGEFIMRDGRFYLRSIDDGSDEEEDVPILLTPDHPELILSLRNMFRYLAANASHPKHPVHNNILTTAQVTRIIDLHVLLFARGPYAVVFQGICGTCMQVLEFVDIQHIRFEYQHHELGDGRVAVLQIPIIYPAIVVYRTCLVGDFRERMFTMVDFDHQDEIDEKVNGRDRALDTGPYVAKVLVAKAWAENKLVYQQSTPNTDIHCATVRLITRLPLVTSFEYTVQCLADNSTIVSIADICHQLSQIP